MPGYRYREANLESHIRTLRLMVLLLALLLAFAIWGWRQAPHDLTVHVPPDLRTGAMLKPGEVPAPNVYAFAYRMLQSLYTWDLGSTDYPKAIDTFGAYLTPAFHNYLGVDAERRARSGELANRTRMVAELPGRAYEDRRVQLLGAGTWVVWLDLQVVETVGGINVKKTYVRYPVRVVRYDIDIARNPWGLALDGFASDPVRLSDEEVRGER